MSQAIEVKLSCQHLIERHPQERNTAFGKPVVVFIDEAIAEKVRKDVLNIPEGTNGRCLAPGRNLCRHRCRDDVNVVNRSGSMRISPLQPLEPRI